MEWRWSSPRPSSPTVYEADLRDGIPVEGGGELDSAQRSGFPRNPARRAGRDGRARVLPPVIAARASAIREAELQRVVELYDKAERPILSRRRRCGYATAERLRETMLAKRVPTMTTYNGADRFDGDDPDLPGPAEYLGSAQLEHHHPAIRSDHRRRHAPRHAADRLQLAGIRPRS